MVLAAQLTGYLVAICLGLIVLVTMLLNLRDFRYKCLLFTSGDYGDDGKFVPQWASPKYCNFVVIAAATVIAVCVVQAIRTIKFLHTDSNTTFLAAFCDLVLCSIITVVTLVAALFVTLGYEEWCQNITKRFATCSDATHNQIDTVDGLDTTNFYLEIGMAQFGCWCLWSALVGLCVCAVLKLCTFHQQENLHSSMARERERQRVIRGGRGPRHVQLVD